MDDWKKLKVLETKKFSSNDGENWYYTATAYEDVVVIKYFESGEEKSSVDYPTYCFKQIFEEIIPMAEKADV